MKQIDLTGAVLNPAARTIDFSALGVDPRSVLAVLHEPTNRFIYASGRQGLGYLSITGAVMKLAVDTSRLVAGPVAVFRDDGVDVATDARLEACRVLIATGNATLSNVATGLGTPADAAPGSDAAAGSLIAKVTRLLLTQSGIASVLAAIRDRLPAALVGGRLAVDGSGVTQPVSAANLPLPAGAATAARQDAAAAVLNTIAANDAPFSAAATLTAGTAVSAGRSVGMNCTTAGAIVLTLSGGGTIALPVTPGWQTFPFAATAFAFSGGAAGTVYNLV